jgi:hypothetical protein
MRFSENVLAEQFRTSERFDGQAGALLGFAGLLAAVAGTLRDRNITVSVGVVAAILAAVVAMGAAFPRRLYQPDSLLIDDLYTRSSDENIKDNAQVIIGARQRNIDQNIRVLESKRRWLVVAAVFLLAAAAITGAGILQGSIGT